jgi:hypothetical protein
VAATDGVLDNLDKEELAPLLQPWLAKYAPEARARACGAGRPGGGRGAALAHTKLGRGNRAAAAVAAQDGNAVDRAIDGAAKAVRDATVHAYKHGRTTSATGAIRRWGTGCGAAPSAASHAGDMRG